MSKYNVTFQGLDAPRESFENASKELVRASSRLHSIANDMDGRDSSMASLAGYIRGSASSIPVIAARMQNVSNAASAIKEIYYKAEEKCVNTFEGNRDERTILNLLSGLGAAFLPTATAMGVASAVKMLGVKPENCQYAGDPVNVATGSFYINAKDLEMPDLSGDFNIERKYSSINKRTGLLGFGWSLNLESSLFLDGNTVTVLCPDGHTESFYNDGDSWRNTKGDSLAFVLSYLADETHWIMTDTLQKKKYVYDAKGLMVEIADRNNNRIEIGYQESLPNTVRTSSNHIIHFTCADGKITQIEDELGRTTTYKYTGSHLAKVIDTEAGTILYEYDSQGYICSITDQNNNTYIKNKYDHEGRVIFQEYANHETCSISYDIEKMQTRFEYSPDKRIQTYRYNDDYLVTQVIYEDGSFEEYGYDGYQNKTALRDRNGNITRRQYDINGNILREELPNGLITEFRYDDKLNPVERSDNNGGQSRYTYDANSNIIIHERKVSADIWQTTKYDYDKYGRIIKTTDPLENVRGFSYEDGEKLLPRPNTIEDSESNVFSYEYDRVGRNIALMTSYGKVEYTLNGKNQVIRTKDALGNVTRKVYDGVGNLVRLITPSNYNPQEDSGDAYEYQYDPMDELIAVADPLGNVMKNIRDTRGNIIKEINPNYYDPKSDNGIGIEFIYDHDNRRIKIIYPDGGIERFFYDSNGNIVRHIAPEYYNSAADDGEGLSYTYNSMNQLVQIKNANGKSEKTFQYDLYGRVIQETATSGSTTLYRYDLASRLIEKRELVEKRSDKGADYKNADKNTDKNAYRITRYEYDLNGNKIRELHGKEAVSVAECPKSWHEVDFAYDRNNRLIKVSDKSGAQAEYRYDCLNRKTYESIRINSDTTRITQYKYNALGALAEKIEIIDGKDLSSDNKGENNQSVTLFTYDKNRNITRVLSPNGYGIRREYDKADRLARAIHEDSRNGIHREFVYDYDAAGNLIAVTNNTDHLSITRKEFKYDAKNRMTHKIDELGNITRIYYDKNNRIIKQVLPEGYDSQSDDGNGMCLRYNLAGQITEVINPLGQTVANNKYDLWGLLIETTDGVCNVTEYAYNPVGQISEVFTPNSRLHNQAAQKYTYDARGNITGIEDGNGNTTSYLLDDWGRVIQTTAPDGTAEKYAYDYAGNIISTTDNNGNAITYTYNSLNKLSGITDQLGNTETFYYDMEGNLTEHIDRNENRVLLSFNMDRNLTLRRAYTKDGQESVCESFSYSPDGTLKAAVSNGMAYSYSYTSDLRLKSKKASDKTLVSYGYDKNGRLKELRNISGKTTRYAYDAANRLKQVIDGNNSKLAEYSYNPDNTLSSKEYGNGIVTCYAYDGDKNLTGLKAVTSKGNTLAFMNFSYDLNGNLLKEQGQQHTASYAYDSLNRLKEAVYDTTNQTYGYNRVGNRIEKTIGDAIEKYTYNAKNQLTQIQRDNETTSFFYDNQGNLTLEEAPDGTSIFSYDALNRQIQAAMKDGNTLVSRYDAEGLRAELEENEKLTKFVYQKGNILTELDEDFNPLVSYTRGSSLVTSTLWNVGTKEEETKVEGTYYYHQDRQGSSVYITDTEETVQNSYRYDAFGMFLENSEQIPNRITYTGQPYDSLTSQYYLRARYYNPVIGRFTQEDPYRGDGLNLYTYVSNNPVSYYDPTGYSKCGVSNESTNKLPPWGYNGAPPEKWHFNSPAAPWGNNGAPPHEWGNRTLEDLYKINPESMKNQAIQVSVDENAINIKAYIRFSGDADKIHSSSGRSYAEIIKEGIESKWSKEIIGTNYDFGADISGDINVEVIGIMPGKKYITSEDQKYFDIEIRDKKGTSNVTHSVNWSKSTVSDSKMTIYTIFDKKGLGARTEQDLYSTAAHEFGHMLGVEDSYKYFSHKYKSPSVDMMRWYNSITPTVTNSDILMMLRAFEQDEMMKWSDIGLRRIK